MSKDALSSALADFDAFVDKNYTHALGADTSFTPENVEEYYRKLRDKQSGSAQKGKDGYAMTYIGSQESGPACRGNLNLFLGRFATLDDKPRGKFQLRGKKS